MRKQETGGPIWGGAARKVLVKLYLRLELEPMCWDSNPDKTLLGTLNSHSQDSNPVRTQGLELTIF